MLYALFFCTVVCMYIIELLNKNIKKYWLRSPCVVYSAVNFVLRACTQSMTHCVGFQQVSIVLTNQRRETVSN